MINNMIKLIDILLEIGEGSKYYNTEEIQQGKNIWFKINDPDFPIDNFWVAIQLGDKDDIVSQPTNNVTKPRFDLSKSVNAAAVSFGVVEGNQWLFPVLNKGYLFRIMGTVSKSIKSVLDNNKNIKYLLFVPAQKIKTTNKIKPNKSFKPEDNPPVQQDTETSDNGSQRENLYLAYIKKQNSGATQSKENNWNVITLK